MCLLGPRPTCNVDQIVEICNLTNAIGVSFLTNSIPNLLVLSCLSDQYLWYKCDQLNSILFQDGERQVRDFTV